MSGGHTIWNRIGDQNGDAMFKVYLYPDNSSQDNECENAISNGLQTAAEQ